MNHILTDIFTGIGIATVAVFAIWFIIAASGIFWFLMGLRWLNSGSKKTKTGRRKGWRS